LFPAAVTRVGALISVAIAHAVTRSALALASGRRETGQLH